jgi:hypothetical protein
MASSSVIEQFQQLTRDEKIFILMYPEHAAAIKESKEAAYAETRRRFGRTGTTIARMRFAIAFGLHYYHVILATVLHSGLRQHTNHRRPTTRLRERWTCITTRWV